MKNLIKFAPDGGEGGGGSGGEGGGESGGEGTGQGGATEFRDTLPPEYRDNPALKDIHDMKALTKSYISAQEMIGKRGVALPGEDATPEMWNEYYNSHGRPENGYDFSKREFPDGFTRNEKLENFFKEAMYKRGLSDAQAQGLYDDQIEFAQMVAKEQNETFEGLKQDWDKELRTEFGQAYDISIGMANQTIDKFATPEFRQLMDQSGLGDHPEVVKVFANLGKQFTESGSFGKGGSENVMTPAHAREEIAALGSDKGFQTQYLTATDPGHKAAVAKMKRLYDFAYPEIG